MTADSFENDVQDVPLQILRMQSPSPQKVLPGCVVGGNKETGWCH